MQKEMKKNEKKRHNTLKKWRTKLEIFLLFSFFIYAFFYIIRWPIYHSLLDKNSKKIVAVIIDKGTILGYRATRRFAYDYEFRVKNNSYTGNSGEDGYRLGEKITIEYLESCPYINRPLKTEEPDNPPPDKDGIIIWENR
jgi:hypothetical protein